jgi:hypothetical protein
MDIVRTLYSHFPGNCMIRKERQFGSFQSFLNGLVRVFGPIVHHIAVVFAFIEPPSAYKSDYQAIGIAVPMAPGRDSLVREFAHVALRSILCREVKKRFQEPNRGRQFDLQRLGECVRLWVGKAAALQNCLPWPCFDILRKLQVPVLFFRC